MKNILKAIGLLLFCGVAYANGPITPSFVYETAISSAPQKVVTVSTSSVTGATQVDSPQLANRAGIEIDNIDASANLWCTIASTTPTVNGGRKIAAGSFWAIGLSDTLYYTSYSSTTQQTTTTQTAATVYCISDGASATKAMVTQAE